VYFVSCRTVKDMLAFEAFTAVDISFRINLLPPLSGRKGDENRPVCTEVLLTII